MPAPPEQGSLLRWLRTGEAPPPAAEVVEAARAWGLAGLLEPAAADWPAPLRQRLREGHLSVLMRTTRQLAAGARAIEVLAAHGLHALPLKGAAVAEDLYTSVGQRPMEDVDLLLIGDWPAAVAALGQAGLAVVERAAHAWSFRGPDGTVIELHHALTSCPRLFPVDGAGLWARSRRREGGQISRVPAPEDLLVQGALHAAFQHGLAVSPVQYLDLRRLLERELDLARVRELAGAAGAESALLCALAAAEAVVGAVVPGELRRPLEQASSRGLRRRLDRRLADPPALLHPSPRGLARLRWDLAAGRRRLLIGDTLDPGDASPGPWARWRRMGVLAAALRRPPSA